MLRKIFNYFLSFFVSKKTIRSMNDMRQESSIDESKSKSGSGFEIDIKPKAKSNDFTTIKFKITKKDLDVVKTRAGEENAIAYANQVINEGDHDYKTWLKQVLQKKYQNPKIDDQYIEDYAKFKPYQVYLNSSFSDQEQKTTLPYIKKIFEKTCDDLKNKDPKIEENPFFTLYRYGVSKINTPKPMASNAKSNFYVHNSKINGHASYFVFEVDKNTQNIKAISYCDGNPISDDRIINDNQINGVTTFRVNNDLKFNQKYVDDFIKNNSQDVSQDNFYKKLRNNSLNFLQASVNQNAKEHSVECQKSKRGNCGIKSINIMQRFLIDQTENRSDQEKKELYKDFKKQLTLTSLDQLVTMTNKAFDKDYPPYQEIDKDPLKINAIDSLKEYYHKAQGKNNEEAKAIIKKLSKPVQQIIGIDVTSENFTSKVRSNRVHPLR
ncbi:hypothetical protein LBMAG18_09660 [Alphaproteobacteria bacterium]|nr:hypothetical protein LBMAG18_09660 [Alphaproteobacteria bacterium]